MLVAKPVKAFLGSENWPSYLSEYEQSDDRSCALIIASYLDQCLEILLRQSFVDARLADDLLVDNGPLGTFAAKIKLARSLNLISGRLYHDIQLVRKLRNHFAHNFESAQFNQDPALSWCRSMEIPKKLKYANGQTIFEAAQKNPRTLFVVVGGIMATTMESTGQRRSDELRQALEGLSACVTDFGGET